MIQATGMPKKIAPPEDPKWGSIDKHNVNEHDWSNKRVVQEKKKRIKERDCMAEHFSPPCSTFVTRAQQNPCRSVEQPEDVPALLAKATPQQQEQVEIHTKVAKASCAAARMKYEVGDYFSVEQPLGSIMLHMNCVKELEGLPRVFRVVIDNCG